MLNNPRARRLASLYLVICVLSSMPLVILRVCCAHGGPMSDRVQSWFLVPLVLTVPWSALLIRALTGARLSPLAEAGLLALVVTIGGAANACILYWLLRGRRGA
jgi:hypothetical protein